MSDIGMAISSSDILVHSNLIISYNQKRDRGLLLEPSIVEAIKQDLLIDLTIDSITRIRNVRLL